MIHCGSLQAASGLTIVQPTPSRLCGPSPTGSRGVDAAALPRLHLLAIQACSTGPPVAQVPLRGVGGGVGGARGVRTCRTCLLTCVAAQDSCGQPALAPSPLTLHRAEMRLQSLCPSHHPLSHRGAHLRWLALYRVQTWSTDPLGAQAPSEGVSYGCTGQMQATSSYPFFARSASC
jgi:hypothetical protein